MSRTPEFEHCFVQNVPRELKEGVLYVSMEFATALHQCACGCGSRVVTPFSPTDWKVTFDGQSVSLNPSIGNWSLRCRSHYFIRNGHTLWANDWSNEQVNINRQQDKLRKGLNARPAEPSNHIPRPHSKRVPWFNQVWKWVTSRLR